MDTGLVSSAFILPAGKFEDRARRVLEVVDRVHRVGPLPRIPIDHRVEVVGADRQYRFKRHRGEARGIGISRIAASFELVLLHEIGHFLDHQVLGNRGGFASTRHPALDGWRHAVRASRTFQALSEGRRLLAIGEPGIDDFDYLLDYTELWARSYAQFLAIESHDATLLRQLAAPPPSAVPYQWAQ